LTLKLKFVASPLATNNTHISIKTGFPFFCASSVISSYKNPLSNNKEEGLIASGYGFMGGGI
jgi:hypothetical protein